MMAKRPPLVQKMLDHVKKQGDYYEDVPKHWMSEEHGMEHALVKYVEELEQALAVKQRKVKKAVKVKAELG